MRIFGSISRIVSVLFRKDSQDITVRPNQSTTYTAARDIQLPPQDANSVLVSESASQSLTGKTIVVASNTITTAASGNLSATELNAALAELQGDIDTRATASSVSDHLSDSSDAHDASAISFSATGNIAATDVQAAIAELDSEKLALAGGTMTGALTLSGSPSAALHAATKGYVDNAINGLSWKQAVRLASTANVVLASALEAGDTIDGEVLVTGDRVLLKDQTNTTENGIYVVKASGAPDRSSDMDETTPVNEINGAACFVADGTQRGISFVMAGSPVSTLGSDALVFVQFSAAGAYIGGTGITVSGNTITSNDGQIVHDNLSGFVANEHIDHSSVSVATASGSGLAGGGDLTATRNLSVSVAGVANVTAAAGDKILIGDASDADNLKYVTAQSIADLAAGSAAQAFTWTDGSSTKVCTHTFGTEDVVVELYDNTSKETVYADFVDRTGTNEVTITRSEATVGADWRVVIRN
jgi:hypothetical protein